MVKERHEQKTIAVFVSMTLVAASFLENRAAAPAYFQKHDSSDCWNREGEEKEERVRPEWETA